MFHLIINDQIPIEVEKYHDALTLISERMASWNNYEDHRELRIKIFKVKDPNALGIHVKEEIQAEDVFGRS